MRWFLLLIVSASGVWAQFPLPTPTRPTSFPLSRPTRGGEVHVWGWNNGIAPPNSLDGVVQIASGNGCEVALKADGTVLAWGNTDNNRIAVPIGLNNVVQVAMSGAAIHGLALKSTGEVVSWGTNQWGAAVVPTNLGPVVQVAVGGNMSAALLADGTVRVWGFDDSGSLRPPNGLDRVVRISAGWLHMLALRDDGTVVTWGYRDGIPSPLDMPSGLQDVVQIAAGSWHSLALKRDGTVVQWPPPWPVPNLSNTVSVAAGTQQFLALASNGVVTAWGGPYGNNAPTDLTDVFQLSCGNDHNAVLFGPPSEPVLSVRYPAATNLTNDAPAQAFDATLLTSATPVRVYALQNSGNAALSNIVVSKLGADSSHFQLTGPTASSLAPRASTTFGVSFVPTASGSRAAQISITSNDTNNSPFIINLSGFGIGTNRDTDADGLNDAAEFKMRGLGFDWQVAQPALVGVLSNNINTAGFFTANQYNAFGAQRFAAGQTSVTTNPTAFGLFTAAQYNLFGVQRFSNGVSSVLNSIPRVEVSAPSSTFMRLGVLSSNFTGITVSNVPPGWRFDTNARQLIGTFAGTNPVSATMVARRGTNPPVSVPVTFKPLLAQTITWTNLSATSNFITNGLIPLRAKSSSGLPVTYTSAKTNVLQIVGTNAVIRGRGTNTITASQPGNTNYLAASNVVRTIVIK